MRRPHPILAALARIRLERRTAQTKVAAALYIPQPSVSMWETGKRNPTLAQVDAYAREFGLRLALVPIETPDERQP